MKKYNHYLLIAASLFVISCGPSEAKKEAAQKQALADTVKTTDVIQLNTNDAAFVNNAAQGGLMEVQMGQLAQRNGLNVKVKEFGEMMVKHHGQINADLTKIAKSKNIEVPAALGKEMQDRVDSLALVSSAGFDLKYMEIMVAAHKKDVAEFEKASSTLKDQDLKVFVDKTLPMLKSHLTQAESINAMINKKNAANNKM